MRNQEIWLRRLGALLSGIIGYTGGAMLESSWLAVGLFFVFGYLGYNWPAVVQLARSALRQARRDVDAVLHAIVGTPAFLQIEIPRLIRLIATYTPRLIRFMATYAVNFGICFASAFVLWAWANSTARIPADASFLEDVLLQAAGNLIWMAQSNENFAVGVIIWCCCTLAGLVFAFLSEFFIVFFVRVMEQSRKSRLKGSRWLVRCVLWPLFYGVVLLIPHFVVTLLLTILHDLRSFKRFMHGVAVTAGGSVYLAFVPFYVQGIPLPVLAIGCGLACLGASELTFRVLEAPAVQEWVIQNRRMLGIQRRKLQPSPA